MVSGIDKTPGLKIHVAMHCYHNGWLTGAMGTMDLGGIHSAFKLTPEGKAVLDKYRDSNTTKQPVL